MAVALGVGAMLFVRRYAPAGSVFEDGDRAAGVFGVLATGFAMLLGLIVFLAFASYDQSRSGAETEALLGGPAVRDRAVHARRACAAARRELVCYGRSVIHQEWPALEAGTQVEGFNPWGVEMFRTLKTADPRTAAEQAAYDKWLDRTADREEARQDRIHGAVGRDPDPLWVVLFFISAVIFAFILFFADSGERWYAQAMLMGSVVAVITATLLLISFLDHPFQAGFGGLRPVAMERTVQILDQERKVRRGPRSAAVRRQRCPRPLRGNHVATVGRRFGAGFDRTTKRRPPCRLARWNGAGADTASGAFLPLLEFCRTPGARGTPPKRDPQAGRVVPDRRPPSRKARLPSAESGEASTVRVASSVVSQPRWSSAATWVLIDRRVAWTATGEFWAIRAPRARRRRAHHPRRSSRLTRPSSSARRASIGSPVSSSSVAMLTGRARGPRNSPPQVAMTPRDTSGNPKLAAVEATTGRRPGRSRSPRRGPAPRPPR